MTRDFDKIQDKTWKEFKDTLADICIDKIENIRINMNTLLNDKQELKKILALGAQKAQNKSTDTIKKVKDIIGFL